MIAATQTAPALRRIAREAVEDLAADGVIHAELRFAPLNHVAGALDPDDVMAAVVAGIDDAAACGCDARLIVCAMREQPPAHSLDAARLAARWQDRGVVAIDLAGGEVGNPASGHAEAFEFAAGAGLGITVHAGEMDGVHQISDALDSCRPDRIGHGWRIVDDCRVVDGRIVELGPTAARLRDGAIPLEICLTSNECLGLALVDHPVRMLFDAGFALTLSPDDRSITTTTARREYDRAAAVHGFTRFELAACAERAAAAAFLPDDERERLVARVAAGWDARPARLVHLAERDRWEAAHGEGAYLPAEWAPTDSSTSRGSPAPDPGEPVLPRSDRSRGGAARRPPPRIVGRLGSGHRDGRAVPPPLLGDHARGRPRGVRHRPGLRRRLPHPTGARRDGPFTSGARASSGSSPNSAAAP
ncbi:MAG: hypothetical protein R2695_05415 [Acidimicrobiales bacterium]